MTQLLRFRSLGYKRSFHIVHHVDNVSRVCSFLPVSFPRGKYVILQNCDLSGGTVWLLWSREHFSVVLWKLCGFLVTLPITSRRGHLI